MSIKAFIPPPEDFVKQILLTAVGIIGAAWLISRSKTAQTLVQQNSITVNGNSVM